MLHLNFIIFEFKHHFFSKNGNCVNDFDNIWDYGLEIKAILKDFIKKDIGLRNQIDILCLQEVEIESGFNSSLLNLGV